MILPSKIQEETDTHLLSRSLIKMSLNVEIAQSDSKVGVNIGSTTLPSRGPLLQTKHRFGELEAQVSKGTEGHGSDGREDTPPHESFWNYSIIFKIIPTEKIKKCIKVFKTSIRTVDFAESQFARKFFNCDGW